MAVEDPTAARLIEIAGLLGCPVQTFFEITVSCDIVTTHELLRLWGQIDDRQARQRILQTVREEVRLRASLPRAAESKS